MELRFQAAAWDQPYAAATTCPTAKANNAAHEASFDPFQEANLLGLHLGVNSSLARLTDGLDRLFRTKGGDLNIFPIHDVLLPLFRIET